MLQQNWCAEIARIFVARVEAEGPVPPSSESLTHGMLYALDPSIRFVFHVHSPDIWYQAQALKLPRTAPDVAYGTPAMAREMDQLMRAGALTRRRMVVMAEHEDGVIAFGRTAEQAGVTLARTFAQALALHVRFLFALRAASRSNIL